MPASVVCARWWTGWGRGRVGPTVTEYTEGTVIIDVIEPTSRDLLWRGRGVAIVSDDEREYLTDLRNTVAAILEKFPRAQPAVAQIRPAIMRSAQSSSASRPRSHGLP
jgi:hypothetical protein